MKEEVGVPISPFDYHLIEEALIYVPIAQLRIV